MPFAVHAISQVSAASAALCWIAAETRARVLVRSDLTVVWHNEAARDLLGPATGIGIADGSLACGATSTARTLVDYLSSLGPKLKTLAIPRDDNKARLLLRGRMVKAEDESLYAIELATDGRDIAAEYRDVDTSFGLTRAEHRVVLGMLEGRQVIALADHLCVSIDTVRTHVRRIYAKLGVGSREEMFALLASYRVS